MSEEHVDLDQLMAEIFGTQQLAEQKFYLWYDELSRIIGFAGNIINEYESYPRIDIDRDMFETLSNDNIHNYIVDLTVTPPRPVNIGGNDVVKNSRIPRVKDWADSRLVKIEFVKSTRKLTVTVNSLLPAPKKAWIIPAGNYMVPLLFLELQNQGTFVYDIPAWLDSTSCWCISDQPIDIFTAYREVDNEENL
jgi:hypothetical protein